MCPSTPLHSYYRHFNLYKYTFGKRTITQLLQVEPHRVESIKLCRPLDEALAEDPETCQSRIPPPPPTPDLDMTAEVLVEESDIGKGKKSKKGKSKKR